MNSTLENLSKYHPFRVGMIAGLSLGILNGFISLIGIYTSFSSVALFAIGFILWVVILLLPGFLIVQQGNSTRIVLLVGGLTGITSGFISFFWTFFLDITNASYINKVQNSLQLSISQLHIGSDITFSHELVIINLLFGSSCIFLFRIFLGAGLSFVGGLIGNFDKRFISRKSLGSSLEEDRQ